MKRILILFLSMLLLCGCTTQIPDYTLSTVPTPTETTVPNNETTQVKEYREYTTYPVEHPTDNVSGNLWYEENAPGGAAHVAGVTAALTTVPVIGVPIKTSALGGMDSLLSIVQMPGGIPVSTTAINGAKNAALIAASIFALTDKALEERLIAFRKAQTEKVLAAELPQC